MDAAQSVRFAHWMSALLCSDPTRRAAPELLPRGRGGPPTLWGAGISGDRPIALLCLGKADESSRVEELLRAQRYWRRQHFAVDVVLLITASGADGDALQATLDPQANAQKAWLNTDDGAPKAEQTGRAHV